MVPIDTTGPNPNGMEFDNLYLDSNGIIHPCFHPENWPAPSSYDEVFTAVFEYIDRIVSLIRPRKLLFMAIDGVAPRAKMNHQRSRRFRNARDAAYAATEAKNSKDKFEGACEKSVLQDKSEKMDSNIITPGTEFMASLSVALQYYIQLKLSTDPGWRGVKVILSDATVPGEGEHKIISYIRSQRNLPGFDPNTRHCFYGLDADLIMLALATHEIHFSILREDRQARRGMCNLYLKSYEDVDRIKKIGFQFIHIWILREYLEILLPVSPMKTDLERLIDDFVFMCLFVGNDFLPHIPTMDIFEGAIELLIEIYRKEFCKMGGYLTNYFEVDLCRVEHFLQIVGSHETAIVRKRSKYRNAQSGRDAGDGGQDDGLSWMYGPDSRDMSQKELFGGEQRYKVLKYVEGLCWCMHYYYQGVCSWQWFYPYHYAPFASDFKDLKSLDIKFTLGKPFKPFDQLMSVLPTASAHALPMSYKKLMTDPSSSIKDFYPQDFAVDMNGRKFSWQAVCKLPFIKESCLIQQIESVEHNLTDEEKKRNAFSFDLLFFHESHRMTPKVISFYKEKRDSPKLTRAKLKQKIRPKLSDGMNGLYQTKQFNH